MDFTQEYILEDERALLRPLAISDYAHLLPFSLNEQELWQYSAQQADSAEKLKIYIEKALIAKNNQTEYPFIVFDKKTQQYAGSTRFYDIDLKNDSLQLGYTWYGKAFHKTGLNRHCKFLLLQFAFETLNINRVEFRADYRNKNSIAAMKAIGCKEEGVLRQNMQLPNNVCRDSIILSILKEEWQNDVKAHLQSKMY